MLLKQYIQTCIDKNDENELLLSWNYAGGNICNIDTKFYKEGSVYLISSENTISNCQLVYCENDYNEKVNWESVTTIDEANQTTLKNGLSAPCFYFFQKKLDISDLNQIVEAANTLDYKPFEKYKSNVSENTDIIIDDDQYYQIMQAIGVPFIKERELEYNRQAILKLAVEPALKMYYTYFPIVQEQIIQRSMGDYLIPYPTDPYPAYKAIAWVTSAGAMGSLSLNKLSPLAALGTDVSLYTRATTGNRFAQGLHYNKPVPGFTGEGTSGGSSAYSELATAWPIANTMKNIMRREKLSKIHIPGKGLFAKGYSSMSGFLNIRWLCWSKDYNDVEFEDFSKVLELCQAFVKKSIGSIRELLRTDSNIPFKEGMQKEGEEKIKEIENDWKESPIRLRFVTSRGGVL